MHKRRNLIIGLFVGIGFIIAMHYIPISKETGSLVTSSNSTTCQAYSGPVPHYHRIIPQGFKGFSDDEEQFAFVVPAGSCAEPVDLRLYLW